MNESELLEIRTIPKVEWEIILQLSVAKEQSEFIESSDKCLEDAMTNAYDMKWSFYGVYSTDTLIGFAMHGMQYLEGTTGKLWLDRFMIDEKYQGMGYGKKSMQMIIQKLYEDWNCQY